jgi:hypothetical protein
VGFLDRLMGKPLDKPTFAGVMVKALAKQGIAVASVDVQEFQLVLGADDFVNLHNVYGQYVAAGGSDRVRVIENFVATFAQKETIPASYEAAKKSLMPVIRGASFNSLTELHMRFNGKTDLAELSELRTAHRPIAEGVVVGLAFDGARSLTHINERQMTQWSADFETALSDAVSNLRDRTPESEIKQEAPGVFAGRWRDSYESSRILLPDLVYRMGAGLDPVCFIPARDEFLVASRGDLQAIKILLRASEETHFGPYGLCPAPFVLVDGVWKTFEGDDDESRVMIRNQRLKRLGSDYGQQKQYLDAIYKRDGVDLFVASCLMNEDKTSGAISTVCAWTNGVKSSFPETEKVALLIDVQTKEHIIVTWEALRRVTGETLQEEPGLLPKRYLALEFPSVEQIEELRRDA